MFKSKLLRYALLLSYSLALLLIWGVGLLQIDIASRSTAFFTFLFTTYSIFYIKRDNYREKAILMIGPVIYIAATLIIRDTSELGNFPIVWIFILYTTILFFGKLNSIWFNVYVISYTLTYTFFIYGSITNNYEFKKNNRAVIQTDQNLSNFQFINYQYDTITLKNNGKPFLIETWNETCKPCISSIRDMQDTLSTDTTFNHIYLYQKRGYKNKDNNEIFEFDPISDKKKIIVDLNNQLYNRLALDSYPYFLIFNEKGYLVDYYSGYSTKYRSEILDDLFKTIKRAN